MTQAPIIRSLADLRRLTKTWHRGGEVIGVVPTMGALHAGHLSLAEAARQRADRVIVTIFVNPKQFNSPEDLANYPRTEEDDARKLAPLDVDVIYCPDPDQIYPDGFSTNVSIGGLTDVLCGAHRPGHFDGVATVVTKLLLQTSADLAFFGEKDFQQLQLVRRLALDLDIPVEIVGCPTVREADGLALSSRNLRLGSAAREVAPRIAGILTQVAEGLIGGGDFADLRRDAVRELEMAGFGELEYLDYRSERDLTSCARYDAANPARIFIAVWLDGVRLIDNLRVAQT